MTDMQIIDLFFERSEQAISALDEKHGGVLRHLVGNILGDERDAEECLSDTYLGVWNAIPPHRPNPLRTYVCAIARNLAIKRYHSNAALKRNSHYDAALDELAECVPSETDVEKEYAAKELAAAINTFIDGLGYDDKYLFMRRYWYADELSDIARQTGLNVNSISVRLYRLRKKLQKQLLKEGLLV